MRNVDKIKGLEYELGRYQKKVADQEAIIKRQNKMLETATAGLGELRRATDAILAQAAVHHGETITDDDGKTTLGFRLEVPMVPVAETLAQYEVKARRDAERRVYVIGAFTKEAATDAG